MLFEVTFVYTMKGSLEVEADNATVAAKHVQETLDVYDLADNCGEDDTEEKTTVVSVTPMEDDDDG